MSVLIMPDNMLLYGEIYTACKHYTLPLALPAVANLISYYWNYVYYVYCLYYLYHLYHKYYLIYLKI